MDNCLSFHTKILVLEKAIFNYSLYARSRLIGHAHWCLKWRIFPQLEHKVSLLSFLPLIFIIFRYQQQKGCMCCFKEQLFVHCCCYNAGAWRSSWGSSYSLGSCFQMDRWNTAEAKNISIVLIEVWPSVYQYKQKWPFQMTWFKWITRPHHVDNTPMSHAQMTWSKDFIMASASAVPSSSSRQHTPLYYYAHLHSYTLSLV